MRGHHFELGNEKPKYVTMNTATYREASKKFIEDALKYLLALKF